MTEDIFGTQARPSSPGAKLVISYLSDVMREHGDEETMRAWYDMLAGLLAFGFRHRGAVDVHGALVQALDATNVTIEIKKSTNET